MKYVEIGQEGMSRYNLVIYSPLCPSKAAEHDLHFLSDTHLKPNPKIWIKSEPGLWYLAIIINYKIEFFVKPFNSIEIEYFTAISHSKKFYYVLDT